MSGHPQELIPDTEAERLAAVRRYDVLDTPPDGAFDRITALASKHFDVAIAIVSIVDTNRIWFKSHHGIDVNEVGRDPGLCASAILHSGPWVVENAQTDARTLANPLVAGDLGLGFYAAAPLMTSDGHGLGTLCLLDYEPREFSEDQAVTLTDMAAVVMDELELRLAARRAVALESSLREQAEQIARTLQRSLLPPTLPRIPGGELSALYLPADAGVIGGDFYDVFLVDGTCILVVGDVSGKGAAAAAVTSLARHTIRSASLSSTSLTEILETLNRAMLLGSSETELEHFCTALVLSARPGEDGLSLSVAAGGHPAGLILRADGSMSEFGAPGPPAGWFGEAVFGEASDHLGRGEALVLFTDGITEARTASGMLGVEGLRAALAEVRGGSAAETIEAIERALSGDDIDVRDDAAVLVLRAV